MRKLLMLLGSGLLACHSAPSQPVPMVGSASDVSALAGEWNGSYEADDGSRTGSIEFRLKSGADTATGDVLMVPMDYQRPREQPYDRQTGVVPDVPSPATLSIRFVRVQGDTVTGRLDRYRDPVCGCQAVTVFRGRLRGNQLNGRYETLHEESGETVKGKWKAERKLPR